MVNQKETYVARVTPRERELLQQLIRPRTTQRVQPRSQSIRLQFEISESDIAALREGSLSESALGSMVKNQLLSATN